MKTIHLNTGQGLTITRFPDFQTHINIGAVQPGEPVTVVASILNNDVLVELVQTANALAHAGAQKAKLVVPYLLGARYDRIMRQGDSLDLEVSADLINACGFEKATSLHDYAPVLFLC